MLPMSQAHALEDNSAIGVVYPDTREPFRSVFLGIVAGVESRLGNSVKQYVLKQDEDALAVRNWARSEKLNGLIALGSSGFTLARNLGKELNIVVGGVLVESNDGGSKLSGISLAPDPAVMLDRFKRILPSAKRVTVVYRKSENGWLVERARNTLNKNGLSLNDIQVGDLRESAQQFRRILDELKQNEDILWLLQDDAVIDEQAILPLVLRIAWERKLSVVSSNPAHVKKGILLSVYPDNKALGKSLAELIIRLRARPGSKPTGILPLSDLLVALNTQTADHIGLSHTGRQIPGVDLTYPLQ
jgi:putative ABC transport system substrate-binding protein